MRLAREADQVDVYVDGKGYVLETKIDVAKLSGLSGYCGIEMRWSAKQLRERMDNEKKEAKRKEKAGLVKG